MADEMSEALQAMEANEPQANLYRAAVWKPPVCHG